MTELERLQAEIKRLRRTLNLIYRDTLPGSAISELAAQALKPQSCKADSSCHHSASELARIECVSEQAVYQWLRRQERHGGIIKHSDWRKNRNV